MKYLKFFKESKYTNDYRVEREYYSNSHTISPHLPKINLSWFNGDKRCGSFDTLEENNIAYIIGYMKYDKSVDGYQFIKLSIDYLLNNGIKAVISRGNISQDGAIVWQRLGKEDKYNVKTNDRNYKGPNYISDKHSQKIITLK